MFNAKKQLLKTDDGLLYPESDDEPLAETDWHILALILLREGLEDFFTERADVYIGSNLFFYYVEGDPSAKTAPDTMVVKGVAKHMRRTFKTWIERAIPAVIFEICSRKTWKRDLGERLRLYERLRVAEYFVFDPEACYVKPPLRGFRLRSGKYQPLRASPDGSVPSKELGLRLRAEGHMLRLIDARTGQAVPTPQERVALETRWADAERSRAELESQRADVERNRADLERQRADALAAELARLRAGSGKRPGKKR
jgi:Uma2 family endonuclease